MSQAKRPFLEFHPPEFHPSFARPCSCFLFFPSWMVSLRSKYIVCFFAYQTCMGLKNAQPLSPMVPSLFFRKLVFSIVTNSHQLPPRPKDVPSNKATRDHQESPQLETPVSLARRNAHVRYAGTPCAAAGEWAPNSETLKSASRYRSS